MRKQFVFISLIIFFCLYKTSASPATEVRAVWLTTNWNLDWPNPKLSIEGQKKQLQDILDQLRRDNFNTVFFQTRIRGDVFYNSSIEPYSPFAKKGFDALQFAIEECHKRGMECHAWFVTFPAGSKKQVNAHGKNSVVNKRRSICKFHDGEWYLDPGNPETGQYILSLVSEIVSKYDIDGIHFDYIRYPENANKFPDKDTYAKYGKGQNIANWRRNNINRLVYGIYDKVKSMKPWVQVSSSPIGKYKHLNESGKGSWTAYESVYQDAINWLEQGKHDALYPMMYYRNEHFYPYLKDWKQKCNDRLIVPGIGIYRLISNEGDWSTTDIADQIDYTRKNDIAGQAFFRAGNILNNTKGVSSLIRNYYQYPAKLPAMKWLDNISPDAPVITEIYRNENGKLCLRWNQTGRNEQQTFTIYYSSEEFIDTGKPENILATGIRNNYAELNITQGDFGFYYAITASDRYHNESIPCFPVYFSHSTYEK
ncbi:MAG: glycoside hydrolase family 10 protein [Dysgonomonas sp.]